MALTSLSSASLAAALRSFTRDSPLDTALSAPTVWSREVLEKKTQTGRGHTRGASWRRFSDGIAGKNESIKKNLRTFRHLVAELIGSEVDDGTLDDATAETFAACVVKSDEGSGDGSSPLRPSADVGEVGERIRERFGSRINKKTAQEILSQAGAICSLLPKGLQVPDEIVTQRLSSGGATASAADPEPPRKAFGDGVTFHFESDGAVKKAFERSKRMLPRKVHPSLTSTSNRMDGRAVSMGEQSSGNAVNTATSASGKTCATELSDNVDGTWLRRLCERNCDTVGDTAAAEVMCMAVYDLLSSGSSDEVLQSDLFELLGFERFDMIQGLLQQRGRIVAVTTEALSTMAGETTASAPRVMQGGPGSGVAASGRKPAITSFVTIQSAEEKHMRKALKREEKRQARDAARAGHGERQDLKAALGFDADYLRRKREEQLQRASAAPLFQNKAQRRRAAAEQYPNVYDTAQAAMESASFVSGMKISLPLDVERVNTKALERVIIPAAARTPTMRQEQPVPISAFSAVAQMAFKGYKALNRIQSLVFETGYHTNENLLICAPTGAGKTNIAMMTVLRCVEQHIEDGVIQKQNFKIVYIAPMKALASEMTASFGKRLQPLGLSVRELTGDMQLTKAEIMATNMLVTTPEKWDVVTRKSTGDVSLTQLVKLLIIDEVHLLHDDRGPVIESLVARTIRLVESAQTMIRIVGLSATLPNYLDAADFLKVNRYIGLFFFDGGFRPVPLKTEFVGVKAKGHFDRMNQMDDACYDTVLDNVRKGHQVMVFVHARNATTRSAMKLRDMAQEDGTIASFQNLEHPDYTPMLKAMQKSPNKELKEIFREGFGTHHAGMLRSDRNLVERAFEKGVIKVLCCTATLAWGVNLPAHAVVIKGTQLYNADKGDFVDLGVLDIQQIFGRAGRPQYDTFGEATLITTHNKLAHYLSVMTRQTPIESQFISRLADHLNAEIALGTVTNVEEGMRWLSYTYLFQRLRKNPLVYGIAHDDIKNDRDLVQKRIELISTAARALDKARMVRFDETNGYIHSTDLGRVASHFYIQVESILIFNDKMSQGMLEADIFSMISESNEFDNIKVRDEELDELDRLYNDACMLHPVKGGTENAHGKTNVLLQSYISKAHIRSFSLQSDSYYVAQNAARLLRGLFEIVLRKNWPSMTYRLLGLCKQLDKRMWGFESPLRQFNMIDDVLLRKMEKLNLSLDKMRDMDAQELGHILRHVREGQRIKRFVGQFPLIKIHATLQPITRTVLRVTLVIEPLFNWSTKVHGSVQPWYIWVEDPENEHMYHSELYQMRAEHVNSDDETERNQTITFTIPIFEPLPSQYYVRAVSDRWLGAEAVEPISFKHLILPNDYPPHTELLDLQPLPVRCLGNTDFESVYKFSHFNPIQTQVFHTMYHTDKNVLLGAPTGSGKTLVAELAMYRLFNEYPRAKAVYVAPLKALVRERVDDWGERLCKRLGKRLVELTGDVTPDIRAIERADIIVTTPEKWDGVSRSWQNRSYVKSVGLVIIDEIHLLGADRGPVLEVIVSRLNYIASHTTHKIRVVGLSTALANAHDLANWLGIDQSALFNFRPSVRPVPLQIHVNGFPGKHYCPRMASMNKPTYQAIKTYSSTKPALVFVSSRRQTRLTALDLISFAATEDNPKQWLNMPEPDMDAIISRVHDTNLRLVLSFGIGMHHAGLRESDRKIVEELFTNLKIQVLVATSTLAWGVNMPAHLVVVKGTEFFDGKQKRYVDFPITDVMQMMGRAGRPQYDTEAVAVVLVHDVKKHFYKKFMFEPFPVESSLLDVLPDHFNAEIVGGTIASKQDAVDYLTWTYFFRRLVVNPTYYGMEEVTQELIDEFLSNLVANALTELEESECIQTSDDGSIEVLTSGRICSYYYLSHLTMRLFSLGLDDNMDVPELLELLSDAQEFDELPGAETHESTFCSHQLFVVLCSL
eukprot:m.1438323 g.1438323  ORF g.1438323 m.1438323 type:complete len:1940 (+) comp25090_c1_seq3:91-5910(+)